MGHPEENFLNMVHTILDTLNKNQSSWSTEKVIVKEVNAIERDFNQILGNLNANSRLDSGVRHNSENENLSPIIRATTKLCRRMYLFARHHNDEIILKLIDHSENILATGSEKAVIRCCHTILSRAEWMHHFLRPYKVTAAQLAKLHDLIDDYDKHRGDRSKLKISNVSPVRKVSHQIAELKERLSLLDELIDGLITSNMFISEYHHSRIIVDYNEIPKAEAENGSESLLR